MSGIATKAANSVFYKARMAAKRQNKIFSSRERAAEELIMDRTKLANIELGKITPAPDEIVKMAMTYNAPQLMNHFCAHECPIGRIIAQQANLEGIDRMAIDILNAVHGVSDVNRLILPIVADGVITNEEMPIVERVLESLLRVSKAGAELRIWVDRRKGERKQ